MLQLVVPGREMYDEEKEEFFTTKETILRLEHSLVSISKWEARWRIPFLSKDAKTAQQAMDYVRCMTLNQNVNPQVYHALTSEHYRTINEYIDAELTATWITRHEPKKPNMQIVTSELIYYWMVAFQIPMECQKWHLSRLMKLIEICEVKNQPPKKMSKAAIMSRNASLNAARRKALNTKG